MRFSTTPTERQVANICRVFQRATPSERAEGAVWYLRAHRACVALSDDTGHDVSVVAATVSAISPNNSWAVNLDQARALCWAVSDAERNEVPCSTYDGGAKARRILAGELEARRGKHSERHVVAFSPRAPKTGAFFTLLADPTDPDAVVVDGHAWCIAEGERRPLDQVPQIAGNLYRQIANAYGIAAERLGLPAHVVQATTWLAWRRIHETTRTNDPQLS